MLSSLTIKNYKKFHDLFVKFNDGVNVIQGHNEAGKSTLMSAIFVALFQDVNTKSKRFFDTSVNWTTKSKNMSLELNFTHDGASYHLLRDFGRGDQSLAFESTKQSDQAQIQQILTEKLQIPTEAVFRATSFIAQNELTHLELSEDMREQLQRISSVSEKPLNLERSLQSLQTEIKELDLGLYHPSKNKGRIATVKTELAELELMLQEKSTRFEKVKNATQDQKSSGEELTQIEAKIKSIEAEIENYKKHESLSKELKIVDTQIENIDKVLTRVGKQVQQLKQVELSLKDFQKFSIVEVDQDAQEVITLNKVIALRSEERDGLMHELKATEMESSSYELANTRDYKGKLLLGGVGMVGIVAVVLLLLGTILVVSILQIVGLVILTATIVGAGVYWLVVGSKGSMTATGLDVQIQLKEKLQADFNAKQLEIQQLQEKLQGIIKKYEVNSYQDFFTTKAKLAALLVEQERVQAVIDSNLEGKKLQEYEQEYESLMSKKREIEVKDLSDEVKLADFSPTEYLKKRRELDMLLIERRRIEKSNTTSSVKIEENDVNAEELEDLKERKLILIEQLASLEKRYQVLVKTLEILTEALAKSARKANKDVSAFVEKYLPDITTSRYKDMRLSEQFDIEVFSGEYNGWLRPLGQLSLGTTDQIYFVTRVALAKTLLGGKLPVLFLDDPFVTFDAERLIGTRKFLQELAQNGTQIFLFTHDNRYQDWGNAIDIAEMA
jgi:DNA repair exonuclease SbcCD ATPase subunit